MRQLVFQAMALIFLPATVLADHAPLVASGPHPDAPEQVRQYGQLQGDWSCQGSSLQPDGSFADAPNRATWSWYYVLDGHAVQDVWKPGAAGAPWGTNLRTYDAEKDQWNMVWTTQSQPEFDYYTATVSDGRIVMRGEIPARQRPAHANRITFFNLTARHFDWKYEAAAPGTTGDTGWTEFSKLSCSRL